MDVQIKFTLEIISYHMRSWWIMADDNWSAKTYSIQFQAKETSNIDLGLHSLIHTLLHSLIHSHNFTHPLPHLIVHAFHHSPTDLLVHSSPRSKIHSLTQLFTPSRNNPIIHSLPYSFKYSRIIHFSIHSPNKKFIKANIFFIHCDYVYYRWRLIDKCLASVRPPHRCLLWGEPPVSD